MAAIRCTGVTKVYPDGTKAVAAVDLEMPSGQFTVAETHVFDLTTGAAIGSGAPRAVAHG